MKKKTIKQILKPAGVIVGAIIVVGGYISLGKDVISWGLPIWAWQAIGSAIFFSTVIAVLYSHQKSMNRGLEPPSNVKDAQKGHGEPIIQKSGEVTKVPDGKNQPESHLSWLTNIYENDKVNLKALLIVQRAVVSCECDPVMGGQIDFRFDVFNASVISVKVALGIDGYIVFQGKKFHDKPDLLSSHTIQHAQMSTITIRQRILPEVAKAIDNIAQNVDDDILCFDFRGVRILIEEDTVIGKGEGCVLNIAETMKFRVKKSSMKGHPFYNWEGIV